MGRFIPRSAAPDQPELVKQTVTFTLSFEEGANAAELDAEFKKVDDLFNNAPTVPTDALSGFSSPIRRVDSEFLAAVFESEFQRTIETALQDAYEVAYSSALGEAVASRLTFSDNSWNFFSEEFGGMQGPASISTTYDSTAPIESSFTVTMENPKTLIAALIEGVGRFSPDEIAPYDEEMTEQSAENYVKNGTVYSYYDIYGGRPASFSVDNDGDINDSYYQSVAQDYFAEVSAEEVGSRLLDASNEGKLDDYSITEIEAALKAMAAAGALNSAITPAVIDAIVASIPLTEDDEE